MRLITALFLTFSITVSLQPNIRSQDQVVELRTGQTIERTLKSGESHNFTVSLQENWILQLGVQQRGIDVVMRISSPEGRTRDFDSPTGDQGVENVSFIATSAGQYTVSVSPLVHSGTESFSGRYELKVLDCRAATSDEVNLSKNIEANAAKGKALLKELIENVAQLKASPTKVGFQLRIASLLETIDTKVAKEMMYAAVEAFVDFVSALNEDDEDNYFPQYSIAVQLRDQLIQALTARDPDKALAFMRSSKMLLHLDKEVSEVEDKQESVYTLNIANQIAKSDPKRTYQMAQDALKKGYSAVLTNTLQALKETAPDLSEQLENQIIDKLTNETIIKNPDAVQLTNILLRSSSNQGVQGTTTGLVKADARVKLFDKLLAECLAYSPRKEINDNQVGSLVWTMLETLKSVGPAMNKRESVAAVEKKFAEVSDSFYPQFRMMRDLQTNINGDSIEQSLEAINKAPQEMRDQLYQQVANNAAAKGELNKAREILTTHFGDNFQRKQLLRGLDQQVAYQSMSKGNVEEALRVIRSMPSAKMRSSMVAQIVAQLGDNLTKSAALSLLDQAHSILSPSTRARDAEEMAALMALGKAFLKYDSNRATEIIQPLIDQFNELESAARTLRTFAELEANDGLFLAADDTGSGMVSVIPDVLGELAATNFDLARSLADRVNPVDVRLSSYIEMVRQTVPAVAPN